MLDDRPVRFGRVTGASALVHGALIVALLITSIVQGCTSSKRPKELVTYLDLQSAPQTVDVPEPTPPQPEPPIPEPPKPPDPVIPDEPVKPTPPKPPKPPRNVVQVQTNRVVRRPPSQIARNPPPSAADIRRALGGGPRLSGGDPNGTVLIPSWYLDAVRARMYDAWLQPSGLAATGLSVEAEIRVAKDGRITKRQITRRSGNSTMDSSVQRALDEVDKLSPLPSSVREAYTDIPILFQLDNG